MIAFVHVKNPASELREFLEVRYTPNVGDYLRVNGHLCRITKLVALSCELKYDEWQDDFVESTAAEFHIEIFCEPDCGEVPQRKDSMAEVVR
jgi:hypothetical protein